MIAAGRCTNSTALRELHWFGLAAAVVGANGPGRSKGMERLLRGAGDEEITIPMLNEDCSSEVDPAHDAQLTDVKDGKEISAAAEGYSDDGGSESYSSLITYTPHVADTATMTAPNVTLREFRQNRIDNHVNEWSALLREGCRSWVFPLPTGLRRPSCRESPCPGSRSLRQPRAADLGLATCQCSTCSTV